MFVLPVVATRQRTHEQMFSAYPTIIIDRSSQRSWVSSVIFAIINLFGRWKEFNVFVRLRCDILLDSLVLLGEIQHVFHVKEKIQFELGRRKCETRRGCGKLIFNNIYMSHQTLHDLSFQFWLKVSAKWSQPIFLLLFFLFVIRVFSRFSIRKNSLSMSVLVPAIFLHRRIVMSWIVCCVLG